MAAGNPSVSDPFSLLGLEKTYFLEAKTLEQAYFQAQKKTHPDQFAKASVEVRQQASERSIAVNQAYLLLKDPLLRAGYLLQEEGLEEALPSPEFLEDVMSWQDQKEAGTLGKDEILEVERRLFRDLDQAFKDSQKEGARQLIAKLRYIRRLV